MKIDLTQTHDVEGAFNSIDWSDIKTKYHDPATLYTFSVLNGTKLAGYKIKLASMLQGRLWCILLHQIL